jgi:hypothetical protein
VKRYNTMKTKEQLREELRYIAVKVNSQEEQDAVAKVFEKAGFNKMIWNSDFFKYVRQFDEVSSNLSCFSNFSDLYGRTEMSFAEFKAKYIDAQLELKWANCKVHVPTPEISKKVQEALFKEGYSWCGHGTTVQYLEQPYLFMDNDTYLGYSIDIIYFKQSGGKEVSYREIIGKEVEQKKLNTEFKVGHWYKLRDDYPALQPNCTEITFEGRKTDWGDNIKPKLFDRKTRKVTDVGFGFAYGVEVKFGDSGWYIYHPQDFEEVEEPTFYGTSINADVWDTILTKQQFDEVLQLARQTGKSIAYAYEWTPDILKIEVEEQKMEEIKNYNKDNLAEAKRQVEEQRNNEEVLKAKAEYLRLINKKESIEREIKNFEDLIEMRREGIKQIEEELKVFDAPKKKKRK